MIPAARPPLRRLLVMDQAIRAGSYPNAVTLARHLEVAHRTVQRDLQFLRDSLHAPLRFDPARNGFYYSEPDYRLPLVKITEGELIALFLAEQVLRQYTGSPYATELAAAFKKLTATLPEEVSINLDRLSGTFSARRSVVAGVGDTERFREIVRAAREGRQIELVYWTASRDETNARIVDPYHMALVDGDWYLIAYCHLREDVRMFVPGRIRSLRETGKRFERPARFDLSEYLDSTFRVVRGDGKPQRVRVAFSPAAARYVRERIWHPNQTLTVRRDGSVELTFRLDHLLEIKRWVLSFGAACHVIEPADLRRQVCEALREALASYGPQASQAVGRRHRATRAT